MKIFLLLILAFIDPEMSSKKASFDGKHCILEEDVILEHPFGRLCTHKAILEKGESDKMSFEKAWLEGDVEVFLNNQAKLKGKTAQADLGKRHLIFEGDVTYKEPQGLKIYADRAESEFEEKEGKFLAHSVKACGNVKAFFSKGRSISCTKADYKPQKFFQIEGDKQLCQLLDQDLDIKTSKGYFDLVEEKGHLEDVSANLIMPVSGVRSNIKLEAKQIIFSEKTQMIESDKKTLIEADAYNLKSDLSSFKIKLNERKSIKEAHLEGLVKISGPHDQTLECPGVLKMHEGKQILVLKAKEGHFVSFKSQDLLIKASRARLFYKQQGQKFVPLKLELEDQVQLYDMRENKKIYGKAHQAMVFLEEERVQLYGEGQKRVLYIDESIDLRLSAPEVAIRKNEQGKLSVQGVGAVRFSFNDEEKVLLEKIKKLAHE